MGDAEPHFRIGNGNYARSVVLISLAVAPMIAIGSVLGLLSHGTLNDQGTWAVVWITVVVLGVLACGVFAVAANAKASVFVLWIDFGERVEIRTLLRTHAHEWSDLLPLEIEMPEGRIPAFVPGVDVSIGKHRVLVVKRHDEKSLVRILVDRRQMWRLQRFLRQHTAAQAIARREGELTWKGDTVKEVSFRNRTVDDALLLEIRPDLEDLPDLGVLDLSGTQVTDAGIVHLERLEKLDRVITLGTSITPEAVERLFHTLDKLRQRSFLSEGLSE